jgi:hypothetical protein
VNDEAVSPYLISAPFSVGDLIWSIRSVTHAIRGAGLIMSDVNLLKSVFS